VAARLQKDVPLEKTAQAAILPLKEPYLSITQAIKTSEDYREKKAALQRFENGCFFLTKQGALLPEDAVKPGALTTGGLIAGGVSGAAASAFKGAYRATKGEARKWLDTLYGRKPEDKARQFLDPAFLASLKNIESTQAFIDVASDPYIATYPAREIEKAYGQVINVMPSMDRKTIEMLKTHVRRRLSQGDIDEAEAARYAALEKTVAETEEKKQIVQEGAEKVLYEGMEETPDEITAIFGEDEAPEPTDYKANVAGLVRFLETKSTDQIIGEKFKTDAKRAEKIWEKAKATGKELSQEELAYVRSHIPEAYREQQVEEEASRARDREERRQDEQERDKTRAETRAAEQKSNRAARTRSDNRQIKARQAENAARLAAQAQADANRQVLRGRQAYAESLVQRARQGHGLTPNQIEYVRTYLGDNAI